MQQGILPATMTQTTPFTCALALSGGLDSAVLCAALLREHGPQAVQPVFFEYGSKHNAREQAGAEALAAHFDLELTRIDLRGLFSLMRSALLGHDARPIPQAAYDPQNMAQTAVPGRNLVFMSALAALAESRGLKHVALATHGGDHHLYPDCRPNFIAALAETIALSSGNGVSLLAPFQAMGKVDIVRLGLELDVPFALCRSCYTGDAQACGRCGTCRERLEAFAACGACDPAPYI